MNTKKPASAFTLIELLTVIAIIGILAAILIPVVGRVRDSARASGCTSNLRQIGVGMLLFAEDHGGRAPPAFNTVAHELGGGAPGGTSINATFHFSLWTYVYQDWPFPGNDAVQTSVGSGTPSQMETVFMCPALYRSYPHANQAPANIFLSGNTENFGSARYSYGVNDLALPGKVRTNSVNLDNTSYASQTVFVTETYYWYVHPNWYWDRFGVVPHNDSANFLFYDGHVERRSRQEIPSKSEANSTIFWAGDNVVGG